MQQGNYPIGNRVLAPTDTVTGVVTSTTADIPLSALGAFFAGGAGGFGTMAMQNANAVNITGGSITGTTIGSGTPAPGTFTTLTGIGTGLSGTGPSFTAGAATNIAGGAANRIPVQSGAASTTFITAPTTAGTVLNWNGTTFIWTTSGAVTSVGVSGGSTGLTTSGGPVTGSGTITLGGTLAIGSGGTGQTTAAAAITALGGVDLVNAQTIGGTKTFSTRPVVGTATAGTSDTGAASTAFVGAAIAVAPPKRTAPNFVNSSCRVAQRQTAPALTTARQIGRCDNVGVWASGGAVSAGTIDQYFGTACEAVGVTLTGAGQLSMSIRMEAKDSIMYAGGIAGVIGRASFSVEVTNSGAVAMNYVLVVKMPTTPDVFSSTVTAATSSPISVAAGATAMLTLNNVNIAASGLLANGLELEVQAQCGAVSGINFFAQNFYVNVEATAGTYDAPDYEKELARCRRYLPAFTAVNSVDTVAIGGFISTSIAVCMYIFKVPPRTAPTNMLLSSLSAFSLYGFASGSGVVTAANINSSSLNALSISVTGTGITGIGGQSANFYANTVGAQILFTGAEL